MALISSRIHNFPRYLCVHRSIMTSSSRVQKVMEDLQQNPYFDKYAKKIATLQKTSPEEFVARIEVKHSEQERLKGKELDARRYESVLKPKEPLRDTISPIQKKLEDIFKIGLVINKDAEEIRDIWLKYHLKKDVIAATIPVETYEKVKLRMRRHPTFLFPLPRSQGYEYIMSQAIGNEVHFTTLLCYQVHKENAPECLTMVHYQELAADKGLVLMRGEFDKNVLDAQQAQCLANQFQMYYGQNHQSKLDLLEGFTKRPDEFKHDQLIAELENLSLT